MVRESKAEKGNVMENKVDEANAQETILDKTKVKGDNVNEVKT